MQKYAKFGAQTAFASPKMIYLIPLLAVLAGYAVANFFKPKNKKTVKLMLAFSGSFLLSLTTVHLLPSVYSGQHQEGHHVLSYIGIYIMAGIVIQIVLEYFSQGAEHGHVHQQNHHHIPWLLFISLCLHAFLEGFPVSRHSELAWGIAIHHFPIVIILTAFFKQAKIPNNVVLALMVIFALATPLGTYISESVALLGNYYHQISAVVVGMLFHISSTIIFESNEGHKFNVGKLLAILSGIAIATLL